MAPRLKARGSIFNPRTITAPIGALVMAGVLYTYSVTSIRAAKRNAELHRLADGGQVDMRKESLRRHGMLEPVAGTKGYELFRDSKTDKDVGKREEVYLNENTLREPGTTVKEEVATPRTAIESQLEGWKGPGVAGRRFQAEGRPEVEGRS